MRNIAQRHRVILNELKKRGYVRVQDLSKKLKVSEVTIRKDLKVLEERRLLFRNHGSASQMSSLISDRHIDEKEKVQVQEKSRIADAANLLLEKNDRIIIASGTTLLYFAQQLSFADPITVITSSLKVSLMLSYKPNIQIIQLGGEIRTSSGSVIGMQSESFLNDLTCNKLFVGVDGIDMDFGLTTSSLDEAHLNKCMIKSAQEVIVLADSSKFGKRGFGKICDVNAIQRIITDTNAPASAVAQMKQMGILVDLV
uniref:DeoR/GlpR family DNA-binding transcription regulator n=1 Tax=uncultured Draconibacterium sp. TaxID=1573823 RepID=UPI003217A449